MALSRFLYKALKDKAESNRSSAYATLEVYFNNPAGIGEHPQVVEEMMKQLEIMANAEDCLKTLNESFGQYSDLNAT
jgi:hypothetical protein